jgi:hypothetical protein
MADTDREVSQRIRRGDAAAVNELVSRDHALADLLARVSSASGRTTDECVALAWERLICDVARGDVTDGLRAALFERVITVLDDHELLDDAPGDVPAPDRGAFQPPENRWAGWWIADQVAWPDGTVLTAAQVVRALRRLPVGPRVLLILRDAAAIPAEAAEPIVHLAADQQAGRLDAAREAYLAAIEDEVGN